MVLSSLSAWCVVGAAVLLSGTSVRAQETPAPLKPAAGLRDAIGSGPSLDVGPSGGHQGVAQGNPEQLNVRLSVPHRFLDATNWTLTGIEIGAMLADGITTQYGLHKYPTEVREGNPLARPFVNAGWPGMIAGGAMVVSAEMALRYLLHRKNHHRLERWLPAYLIVDESVSAIHNAVLLSRHSTQRRQERSPVVFFVGCLSDQGPNGFFAKLRECAAKSALDASSLGERRCAKVQQSREERTGSAERKGAATNGSA
jgi:hypothetical protein